MTQTVTNPQDVRRTMVMGFFAGLAADSDVFISSGQDPLLTLEYHRQFTHSLFFIPFGALIVAAVFWLLLRKRMPFARIYLVSLLGYSLSGFIDACTSYGTQLLWPLSDARIAFNIISIVDPLFTVILLVLLGVAWYTQQRRYAVYALCWCLCYLLIGVFQQQRATQVALQLIESRGDTASELVVKPTFGNLLVWRSLYRLDDSIQIDGIRVGFGSSRVYYGDKIALLRPERDFAGLAPDSVQMGDIVRFSEFSNQFVAVHPEMENVVGDIRYSLLANSSRPLWGIVIDKEHPQQHARFITLRTLTPQVKQAFFAMLSGDDPVITPE